MKRVVAVVASGAAALLVAGCSGETNGEVQPSSDSPVPSSSSADSASLPHSGAPAVANPLPESALAGDPCDAVTQQQIKDLLGDGGAVDPEGAGEDQVGPNCRWSNVSTSASFTVAFDTKMRQGLSALYANTKPKMDVFRDVGTVEGFPAVAYQQVEGDRLCSTGVGLADEYTVDVAVTVSSRKADTVDSCEAAKTVASEIVGNLKQKAGGS